MEPLLLGEALAARLDRGPVPLNRQLYRAVRELVHHGALPAGQALPSTRALAASLSLGRNTVIEAYAQLAAEGYLEGRVGSGSYISTAWAQEFEGRQAAPARRDAGKPQRLSARARRVLEEPRIPDRGAFAPCAPDVSQFPFAAWQRLLNRAWRSLRERDVQHVAPGGHPELRAAIAEYLGLARHVHCGAHQVVITSGAQQGLDLCARLLADAGDAAWVENPGYPGAKRAFHGADLRVVPVELDEDGLAPAAAMWKAPARLIYITPSHQFPTGVVMGLARRRELLQRAARHGSWIIEDDYDGEFRYAGKPIASLQGIDTAGRVIYVGSFSKVLFPGLRLGYLVLPPGLAERFALAAARLAFEGRHVEQGALAQFIREGHFANHIRRMRGIYAARRDLIVEAWHAQLGAAAPISGAESGLHVVASLPPGLDTIVGRMAAERGIAASTLSEMSMGRHRRSGLILGYGSVDEREIRSKGRLLAQLTAKALARAA